jgi:hypothetical protein
VPAAFAPRLSAATGEVVWERITAAAAPLPFYWSPRPARVTCAGCRRPTHVVEMVSVAETEWRCLYCLEGR